MNDFQSFSLPELLNNSIARMNYAHPTPIQAKVIPLVMAGKDILASSYTGSGKTGAFAIPLVARIMQSERDAALILTPTRELASQVIEVIRQLTGNNIRTSLLIGGEPMPKQLKKLRQHPRIIVGTPGRVNDHLKRKSLKLNNFTFLVLDETDRMLDMGFGIQIDAIQKFLPSVKQTLLFSATIAKQIVQSAQKYLNNPVQVQICTSETPAPEIKQENIRIDDDKKYLTLVRELDKREGSIVVFVSTKIAAQNIAEKLLRSNYSVSAIHGDLIQRKRDRVIQSFREQKHRIMIATDVASRGLDIEHIKHVINYDPPQVVEDYVHRIGRTARAGRSGSSVNFILSKDIRKWKEIDKFFSINAGEEILRIHVKKNNATKRPLSQKNKKSPKIMKLKKRGHSGLKRRDNRDNDDNNRSKSTTASNFNKKRKFR